MRIVLLVLICLMGVSAFSQTREQYAADAFVITRMVNKLHVQPRPLNEEFSARFFDHFLQRLDSRHVVFTVEDITKLFPYRTTLSTELNTQKTGFLKLVTDIYEKNILRLDSQLVLIQKEAIRFSDPEILTVQEDTSFVTASMQPQKLNKLVKREMLRYFFSRTYSKAITPVRQKALIDSLEPSARKKVINIFRKNIKRIQESGIGLQASLGKMYCAALAETFDPHSAYMPQSEKESFEAMLGNKSMQFGFSIKSEEDDGVTIEDLKPGSPAYKSGQLNKGDKIMSIQWEGKKESDVSGSGVPEVSALLDESSNGKMVMTVQKADGVQRKVELRKEQMDADEDEIKVKSFILKNGTNAIGYISLPAFYTDFDDPGTNVKGCANDVAKAVLRLKKENIAGLVLDLRYNGGGSMQEAIDLSGIFIDAGPVGLAASGGKTVTLKDINRGTVYDGPLVIMVNGASASASEMVAGTLQDYNRAIVMGTTTYGKATSQVVMPLDSARVYPGAKSSNNTYIKLTVGKLYRITGSSAQRKGVVPDIEIPDLTATIITYESAKPNALDIASIPANRFYTPSKSRDSLVHFISAGHSIVDTSVWYTSIRNNIAQVKDMMGKKDISLQWQDAWQQWEKGKKMLESFGEAPFNSGGIFTVENTPEEEKRLSVLPEIKELNALWRTGIESDAWVTTAFKILSTKKQ